MDKNENAAPWTNEKHLHYLNSMEDSFVRRVFETNHSNPHHLLRLDRYIPDTSDSTLDSTSRRSRNHADAAAAAATATSGGSKSVEMDGRDDSHKRRRRRHSFQPYTSSSSSSSSAAAAASVQHDQVVPQIGNRRGDDNL